MNSKSVTSVSFILVGNMLTAYSSIGDDWPAIVLAILGVTLFFIGLIRLKTFLDPAGQNGVMKLIWASVLGIMASGLSFIPVIGFIPAGMFNIASFVLQLIGLLSLKRSETLGEMGAGGVNLILIAIGLMVVAAAVGFLPFAGKMIKEGVVLIAIILIPFGWLKVQEAMIGRYGIHHPGSVNARREPVHAAPVVRRQENYLAEAPAEPPENRYPEPAPEQQENRDPEQQVQFQQNRFPEQRVQFQQNQPPPIIQQPVKPAYPVRPPAPVRHVPPGSVLIRDTETGEELVVTTEKWGDMKYSGLDKYYSVIG
jgi:uncharacterized membrane protein